MSWVMRFMNTILQKPKVKHFLLTITNVNSLLTLVILFILINSHLIGVKSMKLKNKTIHERNELVIKYMPLADRLAMNRKRKVARSVDLDELKSAAYVGLIDAANKFDTSKASQNTKDPFASYAARRIVGQMMDYLRSCNWIGNRKKTIPVFSLDTGERPSDNEEGVVKKSWLVSNFPQPAEKLNKDELFERVVRGLPHKVKEVFRLYYIHDKTMKEVGEAIEISESRVSQMISQHKKYLKENLESCKNDLFENID